MTVVGVVLILVAVVLLGLGLVDGSSALLTGSIALSLLATVMVVVGARQAAAARVVVASTGTGRGGEPAAPEPAGARAAHSSDRAGTGGPGRPDALVPPDERSTTAGSARPGGAGAAGPPRDATAEPGSEPPADPHQPATPAGEAEDEFDDDPPDEPAPQAVSAADAAKVARMSTEVLVIDGRPRYHLPGCVHLLGRESQSLPVSQAVEWDFTPCSLCEPDNALLTDARRV
ncbi:MAG TPA: hypothetical protein VFR67_30015 [Pilimelia sp.]|nr:hypothetical protein [Pilimelia sp.]